MKAPRDSVMLAESQPTPVILCFTKIWDGEVELWSEDDGAV